MYRLKTSVALCTLITAAGALGSGAAYADCGIEGGSVRILSNDFPALQAVASAAEGCVSDTVEITLNATAEHRDIQVAALTANPATYTVAVVATSSIVPLMNDDLIRPLDEYVEKYGSQLQESQLIRVNGQVMAVAFMANSQHLFYREDILEQNGIAVPTNYEELLAAAEKLRADGVMESPLSSNYMPGWNLGAEFVNTYLGTGNDFFAAGSAELAINNEDGLATLEAMKSLTGYMSQDWATFDSNAQAPVWESGEAALSLAWGSRAAAYIADDNASPEVAAVTKFAAAPAINGGSTPAAALWWDGFTIAKNISDEDAEASFQAMMEGLTPEMMNANLDAAVWLIEGYEPTPAAEGVLATLQSGARPYPMLPYIGLLHTALGENLAEYLQGDESAEQAMADIEAAYNTAATEAGFL